MSDPKQGGGPEPAPTPSAEPAAERAGFEARIRELAYLLWESGGRHYGHALEFWLAAEREVLQTFERAQDRLLGVEPGAEAGGEPGAKAGGEAGAKAATGGAPAEAVPAAKRPHPGKQ